MTDKTRVHDDAAVLRWTVIIAVALIALFGSYRFAAARSSAPQASVAKAAAATGVPAAPSSSGPGTPAKGGSGCGCCGTAAKGPATTGAAAVAGDVQKISVDVSKGYYDPSTIELKAGVPAEIRFSQSGGCTAQVESAELGFSEDLTQGPVTVKLPALTAGTYGFNCGMQMVFGSIVVK